MAGDIDNPRIWVGADVYVADYGTGAPTDTTTPLAADWDAVGLLSEDAGMTESRDQDVTDHYAWGGVLVRTTRSKHKRTIAFTPLEDNPVVFDLREPGSTAETAGGVTTRKVVVPIPNPKAFLIELVDGDIVKRRYIPKGEVIDVGDVSISDDEMSTTELTISIYPVTHDDTDDVLFVDITDDPQAEAAS